MKSLSTEARLQAIARAVDVARGRQDPDVLKTAEDVLLRSRDRLARGPQHVVVALGGGTGSGKSSLSNAIAGRPLSPVAPIRPTTEEALLWSVGHPDPELMQWLRIPDRHVVSPRDDLPEGLIVLDLPDHDSVRTEHRDTVDAAVKVVDIMTFVVDPMKYAQRSLFEGYLRPLAHHAEVVLVVLNRADELDVEDERRLVADLQRLLSETGLSQARVLVTSAVTGRGVGELRALLAEETRSRRAISERINADMVQAAEELAGGVGAVAGLGSAEPVVSALARSADLSGAVATAARTYRERGLTATRPPLTALIARSGHKALRPFRMPAAVRLRASGRLGDEGGAAGAEHGQDDDNGPDSPQQADGLRGQRPRPRTDVALRHALRELIEPLLASVPRTWQRRLRQLVERLAETLPAQTRDALDVVALHPPRRLWWAVVGFLWTLVELAVIVGIGWLIALFVIAWLQLPDPPTPQLGEVPWPTVLVLAGVPAWLGLRGGRALAVRRGAARYGARAAKRLQAQVEEAVDVGLRTLEQEVAARDALLELTGSVTGMPASRGRGRR